MTHLISKSVTNNISPRGRAGRLRADTHTSAAVTQAKNHTVDEVIRALEALGYPLPETLDGEEVASPPPWRRLRSAARQTQRRYRIGGPARDDEDLLQEALLRLFTGSRSWRREVDFEYQVARVMDSIASEWRRHGDARPEICEAALELPGDAGQKAESALPDPPSPEPSIELRLLARGEWRQIKRLFANDPEALAVLDCLRRQLSRREMLDRMQLPEKRLLATIRRIQRDVRQLRSRASEVPDLRRGATEGGVTIQLNVAAAKKQFSRLLERVAGGETVLIMRRGKPMARLVPLELPMSRLTP